jgi:hypothetical protein
MKVQRPQIIVSLLPLVVMMAAGLAPGVALAAATETLLGSQEVPAVDTTAKGTAAIVIAANHTVTGSVETTGIAGTMAHIHQAGKGLNGPVVVTLKQAGDGRWEVPADTRLSDEQYAAWKAGNLYVNVHSAAHKGGEIRAQLVP